MKLHVVVAIFAGVCAVNLDDETVILRIIEPQGTKVLNPNQLLVNVSIAIETFNGLDVDSVFSDPSLWSVCYAASNIHAGRRRAAQLPQCVSLSVPMSALEIPPLQLPKGSGTLGTSERWKVDAWLQQGIVGLDLNLAVASVEWTLLLEEPHSPNITRGYRITGGALYADLQILALDESGHLPIPSGKRVWIEVGANSRNTLATTEARCAGNEDVFVVSFEPLLGQYCLLTSSSKFDHATRLGAGESASNLVLPFAVTPNDGESLDFFVSTIDGCSSLLEANAMPGSDMEGSFWNECLGGRKEVRRVPVMSLEALFEHLLPPGTEVDFLKVDTQGTALAVVASAGKYLPRIRAVQVDALVDGMLPLYRGQNTCSQTVAQAMAWGFASAAAGDHVGTGADGGMCAQAAVRRAALGFRSYDLREINLFFARDPMRWRPVCALNGRFEIKEVEDLVVIGLPNQLSRCLPESCTNQGVSFII